MTSEAIKECFVKTRKQNDSKVHWDLCVEDGLSLECRPPFLLITQTLLSLVSSEIFQLLFTNFEIYVVLVNGKSFYLELLFISVTQKTNPKFQKDLQKDIKDISLLNIIKGINGESTDSLWKLRNVINYIEKKSQVFPFYIKECFIYLYVRLTDAHFDILHNQKMHQNIFKDHFMEEIH